MAANLALASQCAVGVYSQRQIGTKFVPKSHHISVKPLVKHSAIFPMFGNPIHNDHLVAKRGDQIKMMVASPTPTSTQGPAIYTDAELHNTTDQNLVLYADKDWYGKLVPPRNIAAKDRVEFRQYAEPKVGSSAGGVVYRILENSNIKWVIAWSNMENEPNKVYTEMTTDAQIDWIRIKKALDRSNNRSIARQHGYTSDAKIDLRIPTAVMSATLKAN